MLSSLCGKLESVSTGDCMHLLRTQGSHRDPESGTRTRTMSEWSSRAWKYYKFYNISRHRRHFNSLSLQRARNHMLFQKTTVKLIFLVTVAKIYLPAKCYSSNIYLPGIVTKLCHTTPKYRKPRDTRKRRGTNSHHFQGWQLSSTDRVPPTDVQIFCKEQTQTTKTVCDHWNNTLLWL